MSDGRDDRFAPVAEAVITSLRGDPNKHLSKPDEVRWGSGGSLSLDRKTGRIYDHEQGEGGGLLWFVEQETGQPVAGGQAAQWLVDNGWIEEKSREGRGGAYGPGGVGSRPGPPGRHPDDPGPQPDPRDEGAPARRDGPRTDEAGNWVPGNLPDGAALAKTYDYVGADGRLAYQVCRYEWPDPGSEKGHGKHFLQRIPDKKKRHGWTYKTKGMTWLPYRLPELLASVDANEWVFVVEGEKKVDMLRERGVAATCNHGGAGKFPESLVSHFTGARVCIIPDNDEAGEDHATLVGRRLRPVAEEVMVLRLPGVPEKGSVDDWFPAGGTVEQLFRLLRDAAEPFVPPPPATKFGGVAWSDLDKPGQPLDWLIKGVVTRGEIAVLAGESQSGKSFLAVDLAMAVARGVDWFGRKTQRCGVIYQAGESAAGLRRRRLPAYRQHHEIDRAPPFVLLEDRIDLFGAPEQIDALVEECLAWRDTFDVPLGLIVVDTLNRAHPGANENDGKDMGLVLENVERLRRETGASILLIHHMNASGTKMRGHSSLYANVDSVITVGRVDDVRDDGGRPLREWRISKLKDGEDGVRHSFVLPAVTIGTDADGDPITSCIVAPPGGGEPRRPEERHPEGTKVSGWTETALRAIYNALNEHGEPAPDSLDLPASARVVSRRAVGRELARLASTDDKGRDPEREKKVEQARDRLYSRGIIRWTDDWLWLTGKRIRGFPPPPGSPDWDAVDDPETGPVGPDLPFDPEEFE